MDHDRATRWLILCEPGDQVAPWVRRGLGRRGVPAEVVTSADLCGATRWHHRVGNSGADVDILLPDGRRIARGGVRAVLNRLTGVPAGLRALASDDDRDYADQEWRALLCSTVHALGAPAMPAPHPALPSGPWRSPAHWTLLATHAGLATRPWCWNGTAPTVEAPSADAVAVFVVAGVAVCTHAVDGPAREACVRLAAMAGESLLQVDVVPHAESGALFVTASTMPDLRRGGEAVLDALAQVGA